MVTNRFGGQKQMSQEMIGKYEKEETIPAIEIAKKIVISWPVHWIILLPEL